MKPLYRAAWRRLETELYRVLPDRLEFKGLIVDDVLDVVDEWLRKEGIG